MKKEVTRIVYNSMLEETGNDITHVRIFFKVDNGLENGMPFMVQLGKLFDSIAAKHPAEGKYLQSIRANISGYGPKHTKVMDIIREENFDLDYYVEDFFQDLDNEKVQKYIDLDNEIAQSKSHTAIIEKAKELKAIVNDDFVDENKRHSEFMDGLDESLHAFVLKLYPDFFEMSDKHAYAYRDLLITTVLSFTEAFSKIRNSQFSDYFEQQYKRRLERDK